MSATRYLAVASLLAVILTVQCVSSNESDALHTISLVVMVPFPNELTMGWDRGPALIPAATIAARKINNSTEILPDFNLRLIVADSGCGATTKVSISFLQDIYENSDHQVVGIIGPGCSGAAIAVSDLTSRHDVSLIHVTPSATSPQLEDPKRNTTFATVSSAFSYVDSFIALINYNNWSRVATLQDIERPYFKQTHSQFVDKVDSNVLAYSGILFVGTERVSSEIPLGDIRAAQTRVVVVFAGSNAARMLLCYAYHQNMTYPNYQYIFHDRRIEQLVTEVETFYVDGEPVSCTLENMIIATHGVILNLFRLAQEDNSTYLPLLQQTYDKYFEEYSQELRSYVTGSEELKQFTNGMELGADYATDPWANSYHDAVWAMAIALHNASMSGVDLKTYSYNRNSDTIVIAGHLLQVEFEGATGPIVFGRETRSVKSIINIEQILQGEQVLIGTYNRCRLNETTQLVISSDLALFINDTFDIVYIRVHSAMGAFVILLTLLLVIVTVVFQLPNIFWHYRSSIKATSHNLSHLIFSGCYLFLIFLLLYSFIETFGPISIISYSILCNAMVWCLLLGYSLIFGTVCAKAWRVHRLFKHFRNKSPGAILSDTALVVFVILLLLIDMLICIAWNSFDPLTRELQSSNTRISSESPVTAYTIQCNCEHWNFWIGTVVSYKGLIVIPLLIIAILNRRIKRKNFKQTKNITVLIYSVSLLGCIGIPLYFLLKDASVYSGYLIFSAILQSTVLLCSLTLFLPPMLPILTRTENKCDRKRSTFTSEKVQRQASASSFNQNSILY